MATTSKKATKKTTRKTTKKTVRKAATKRAPRKPAAKKTAPAQKAAGAKRVSLLDAAATVLKTAKKPMTAKAIVEQVTAKGLWKSPSGKTPHASLYAAMIREIASKGKAALFERVDRGLFAARKGA